MRRNTKTRPSERAEQTALHEYCMASRLISFAIPNGGTRHMLEAINLKKEGVTRGVSDYCVILPHIVLFIEMKRRPKILTSGRKSTADTKASKEQLGFLERINKTAICKGKVCYGAAEAIQFIKEEVRNG